MSLVPPFVRSSITSRRASNNSSQGSGIIPGSNSVGPSVGSVGYDSSSSEWPDDASDKESLQSWAKEQQEKEAEEENDLFASKDEQHLRRWFIFITFALMIVGVCVCIFTYFYLIGQEQENFERGFRSTAQAIIDGSSFKMKVLERALLGQSQQLTTFAVFTGSLWPFVSIPDFAVQGHNFLLETETQMIAWAPFITSDRNLRAWEAYSTYMLQNSGWFPPEEVDERLKKQLEWLEDQAKDQVDRDKELSNSESGLYAPLWQISPWLYNAWIKHNLTAQFEDSILLLLRSKRPVWTKFMNITNRPLNGTTINATTESDDTINAEEATSEGEPIMASFLFQPVFQSLRNHDVSYKGVTNTSEDSEKIVGIYMAAVQWDTFLAGLVPEGTAGVHLVVRNPWGQTLTYEIDKVVEGAPSVSLLVGTGDQHFSEYDELSQATNLTTRAVGVLPEIDTVVAGTAETSAVSTSVANAVTVRHPHTDEELIAAGYDPDEYTDNFTSKDTEPLDDTTGSGHFQMTIYPTTHFEDTYKSSEPFIYTLILAAVVFFAIAVFFLYSRFVYNRQQKLVETANRTALVVKSLFPSNVRDRIMKEAEESELKSKAKRLKKQQQQLDGSNSERGSTHTGGNSVVGGTSVGSTPSRPNRGRRARRPSIDFRISTRANDRRPSSEERSEASRTRDFGMGLSSSMGASSSQNIGTDNPYGSKPIADQFNETTVLFADMVGFTAWSSVREPTQVFQLLETIYHAFDKVAKKRGIFKVETIGDCYAVCGLPVPRPDHAIAMSYFANDCLRKMKILVNKLEVSLGPDTSNLSMRIGLHSGPVTAGVLRGEKSRFQLFGDTVNTAARMESNGKKNCIHISEETADLLIKAGKRRWLTPREEKIHAKGKGELQTFWLVVRSMSSVLADRRSGERRSSGDTRTSEELDIEIDEGVSIDDTNSDGAPVVPDWEASDWDKDASMETPKKPRALRDRIQRLVDWNVDQLVNLLKQIVANRKSRTGLDADSPDGRARANGADFDLRTDSTILQEVTEVIPFPKPNVADILVGSTRTATVGVDLDPAVIGQLHQFMTKIASLYNDNPFHSFAHASHTTMALITWLSRITPLESDVGSLNMYDAHLSGDWKRKSNPSKDMFALQSDPFTHFAMIFAALIHDLEHAGVPNSQLVNEKAQLAVLYNQTSIHEQASVDTAFEVFMDDKYSKLRSVLFATEEEFYRFRQIVINGVMATDILNKKVMAKQDVRWGCLFKAEESDASISDYEPENESDQKSSIVMERLLVISNIAHTMQHWYVYRKWNEKLFEENYMAFKAGRAENDPALTWYKDELEFFDTYVIPLASQMGDCGLFDASCDEYFRYAKGNRDQWANTGREEVASMVERLKDLEFEVKDNYNPIPDGRIFSPSNAGRPKARDWKKALEKFS